MKKQIWPIILYCGWFLMVPPRDKRVLDHAPIQDWLHLQSYDTALECENSKADFIKNTAKRHDYPDPFAQSRCIPADSIPLK
jgi:hypothetical protein